MRISGPLSAVGCPLSVCSLPAFHRHPERSEGSRDKTLVSFSLVTASWREDGIGKTGRRWRGRLCRRVVFAGAQGADGKIVFLNAGGFRRLTAPGFKPPSGWRPGRLRFCPQSGLVQRELCMLPVGSAPLGSWRRHLPAHFVVGLWGLSSGVNLSL